MKDYITPFFFLLEEMAPYLLLGLLIAGILHSFVPQTVYRKWLSGNDLKSVLLSVAFGIPLPLCSCGVVPTAVAMRKEGASRSATAAFLIATPQTGVDSIAATWSVLGLPFAILRPIAALVTGVFGGMATAAFGSDGSADESSACCTAPSSEKQTFWQRCRGALDYGFTYMLQDIGKWLVIGLVLAGLITVFVPDNFFTQFAGGSKWLSYLVVMVIAVPMYVCATGSIPVAAALMMKGLTPGAAFVFLMAGPATNIASMLILGKTLGKKSLAVYLISIITGALAFGLIADFLLPSEWFTAPVMKMMHSCCHTDAEDPTAWWQIVSSILLVYLLVRAFILKRKKQTITENMKTFKVTGMMCNHCRSHVESTIRDIEGVIKVTVDLASGIAEVEGTASPETIVNAVKAIGYDCEEK